ncbi:sulphatase-modifying factor protein [Candidatus Vecturithrix granuli]|uniref:Sulphatase-modifying factor protein n=1 Tax=Vecturithrix granuli TaxID=1499967 RepID=A0A081BZ96_VECG1|nr:sulphatase-modifying factor protein [Candidatus Vecturithrix granuli]
MLQENLTHEQLLAQRRVQEFAQAAGENALHLACHAALPAALTPELLHLLRINFFLDPKDTKTGDPLPYTAETDLLLSPLCQEIGEQLYEMPSEVRNVLLEQLQQEFGAARIRRVAALLWKYSLNPRRAPWHENRRLERAQQLTALNFLDPQQARQWLEQAEEKQGRSKTDLRDWFIAMRRELPRSAILSGGAKTEPSTTPQEQEFAFETVRVDRYGKIIERQRETAWQFTEELGNGVMLEMVRIPAGRFLMGAPESEEGSSDDERPQHEVQIAPFYMGRYPVTQAQWRAVVEVAPQIERPLEPDPSSFKGAQRPVENVIWDDAVEFCRRLSQLTGQEYRLPSEAEWEYACRAGTTTPFYFGETITTDLANYDGSEPPYGEGPKGVYHEQTTEVGIFPPNAFGLYDMHGNVWEWCLDVWNDSHKNAPTDGSARQEGADINLRLLKGGSWFDPAWSLRCAYRIGVGRDGRVGVRGFRPVRAVGGQSSDF